MSFPKFDATREDVLNAFAVEPIQSKDVLLRYLREYPQHASDLLTLSRDLSEATVVDRAPLSQEDQKLIDSTWKKHFSPTTPVLNPFKNLAVSKLREIAKFFDVSTQVIVGLRDGKVDLASIPKGFLKRLAAQLDTSIESLSNAILHPLVPIRAQSFKSDTKPAAAPRVSFEELLIQSGVSKEKREKLMSEAD